VDQFRCNFCCLGKFYWSKIHFRYWEADLFYFSSSVYQVCACFTDVELVWDTFCWTLCEPQCTDCKYLRGNPRLSLQIGIPLTYELKLPLHSEFGRTSLRSNIFLPFQTCIQWVLYRNLALVGWSVYRLKRKSQSRLWWQHHYLLSFPSSKGRDAL